MRYGFTTGSCAAAAAKAAAYMLLTGIEKKNITINTPKGIPFAAKLLDIQRSEASVSCAVEKDGGDDPDVTTGAYVYAMVMASSSQSESIQAVNQADRLLIHIDGGVGVGRVTRLGLDQPVGNAAINHVPREMIEKEVREVCALTDYQGVLYVIISVPAGEELAEKTFNPRLGIVGGISILGTSGIVEPMSSQALLDTIRVELNQRRAEGQTLIAISPGNYGLDYMQRTYGYDFDKSVKCSNYIGLSIDMAAELGFARMLLTGHIGKLVKVAGGIMNTHSREGDCRMELIAAAAVQAHVPIESIERILSCLTTEEAIQILKDSGTCEAVMQLLMEKIQFHLNNRAAGRLQIETILYANEFGELEKSIGAELLLQELLEQQ